MTDETKHLLSHLPKNSRWVRRKWASESLHHEIQLDSENYSEACVEEGRRKVWGGGGDVGRNGSCSYGGVQWEKWVRILTLHSNPITPPNWIGYVHCSDRIRALKHAQGLRSTGSPLDLHFWFCLVCRQLKAQRRNILEEKQLQWNYKYQKVRDR